MPKIKKGKQKAVEESPAPNKLEGVVEVAEEEDDNFGGLG